MCVCTFVFLCFKVSLTFTNHHHPSSHQHTGNGNAIGNAGSIATTGTRSLASRASAISLTKNGKVRIMPHGKPGGLPQGYKIDIDPEQYEDAVLGGKKRSEIKRTVHQKYGPVHGNAGADNGDGATTKGDTAMRRMPEHEVIFEQHKAYNDVKDMRDRDAKKKLFKEGWKPPNITRVTVIPPHEIDAAAMQEAKDKFIAAGLEKNIRKGKKTDVAAYVPSLIPVPGAFEGTCILYVCICVCVFCVYLCVLCLSPCVCLSPLLPPLTPYTIIITTTYR
jgi:hypothetical protein